MLSALARQAIELASRTLGANFIDLVSDPDSDFADRKLRDTVLMAAAEARH